VLTRLKQNLEVQEDDNLQDDEGAPAPEEHFIAKDPNVYSEPDAEDAFKDSPISTRFAEFL
jgi:hypothetical protein